MAAIFPALAQCQENAQGPIELPDHPLVRQTLHDCLHEAMDVDALLGADAGASSRAPSRVHACDTVEPSPLAHEILNGRPYTFLDDAPLEERRTRAVSAAARAAGGAARPAPARREGDRARARRGAARSARSRTSCTTCSRICVLARPCEAWRPWFEALVRERTRGGARGARGSAAGWWPSGSARRGRSSRSRANGLAWRCPSAAAAPARARRGRGAGAACCAVTSTRRAPRPPRSSRAPAASTRRAWCADWRASRAVASPCRGASTRAPPDGRRRVLRAPPAGAHPRLHARASAQRDASGQRAGLPALPAGLAAGAARSAARGPSRRAGGSGAAAGARAGGGRVGSVGAAGARRRVPARVARRALPLGRALLGPARAARGARCECRRRPADAALARHADLAGAPRRPALAAGGAARRRAARSAGGRRGRRWSGARSARAARSSKASSPRPRAAPPAEIEDGALGPGLARARPRRRLRAAAPAARHATREPADAPRPARAPAAAPAGARGRTLGAARRRRTRHSIATSSPRRSPSSCWRAGAWSSSTCWRARAWRCRGATILWALRRLEARGLVRGGRFVDRLRGRAVRAARRASRRWRARAARRVAARRAALRGRSR